MTTNDERALVLARALEKSFERDRSIGDLFTDDVTGFTPAGGIGSLEELLAEAGARIEAFSDVQVEVTPLDTGGEYACAEWVVSMRHTGPLALTTGPGVEATGARITVYGVTVAEFRGNRICSFRQYWDRLGVLEQLGPPPNSELPGPDR